VAALAPGLADVAADVVEQIAYDLKYEGYVTRQTQQVERQQRLAEKLIPVSVDYARIGQLRQEAKEKLSRVRPLTLAQASRISGITPADMALLLAHLEGRLKS
jgi:tRNA uridine 5-carboxymethylaminomethyl modification enzyme